MPVVADKVVVELEAKLDRYKSNVIQAEKVFARSMDGTVQASKRDTDLLGDKLRREYREMGAGLGQAFQTGSRAAQVALAGITIYAIKLAKDAGEIESAFDVAFKGASKGARDFSEVLTSKLGRDAVETRKAMTQLQLVLTGTGVAAAQATELTKALTTAGIDAGSLFNTSDAEAFQKIISGISGEAEPLKAFGVVLTETKVKAELLRLGFKGNAEQASDAAKSIARTNLILKGLAVAQGDAARTSDSAANKQRALTAEFNKTARELGQQLLPAFIKVAGAATDVLKAFNEMPGGLQVASLGILAFVAASGPIAGLLAGLGKVIKLAQATRVALAGVAGASVAAGTAGAAGAGVGTVGALGGGLIAGGAAYGAAGVAGAASAISGGNRVTQVKKLIANPSLVRSLSDAEISKLQERLRRDASRKGLKAQTMYGDFGADTIPAQKALGILAGEVNARAARGAKPGADPLAGFNLPDLLKTPTPSGTGGGRKSGGGTINLKTGTVEVDQDTVVDLINRLSGPALTVDSDPAGFMAAGEASREASDQLRAYQEEVRDNTYEGIRGGLEAGFRDGLPGILAYLGESVSRALLDSAAQGLTSLIPTGAQSIASAIFGRAAGGNMVGGRPYLVNEGRPEVFVPPVSGQMVPLSRMGGGGGTTVIQNFSMGTGNLVTERVYADMQRVARTEAARAGVQSYQKSMRDAPSAVAKRQGERG
jgi:hypothetical protein